MDGDRYHRNEKQGLGLHILFDLWVHLGARVSKVTKPRLPAFRNDIVHLDIKTSPRALQ